MILNNSDKHEGGLTISLSAKDLAHYITLQIENFFPDGGLVGQELRFSIGDALDRMEHCLFRTSLKGFFNADGPVYNHLHSDQHAMFLYFLSNTVFSRQENSGLADKVYGLNKALHGVDIFYEVCLPSVFALVHPVGTVLGRAAYSDFFVAYQNVTVGSDLKGNSPVLDEGIAMYAGSKVIGNVIIGSNCLISAGTSVLGGNIPPNSVAFGQYPQLQTKETKHNVISDIFKPSIHEYV
jgi:serine O-acetyltransferase